MKTLFFYTKTVCPLCDKAKQVIWPEIDGSEWQLQDIYIDKEPGYQHRYAARIPVIKREDFEDDLSWPFTPKQVRDYLGG